MPESPRILELRRRVQSDPASIAFAQLAEEYRRAGNYQEAVTCCRTGLARHPSYLSARVTLGRALIELNQLDDAAREFETVLRTAPDNLAAIRGLAEIHQHRGALESALIYYKRALELARHDPDLEQTVNQIGRELGKISTPSTSSTGLSFAEAQSQLLTAASRMPASPKPTQTIDDGGPVSPEPTQTIGDGGPAAPKPTHGTGEGGPDFASMDFDSLLRTLGAPDATPPPPMEMLLTEPAPAAARPDPVLPELPAEVPAEVPAGDPFAALERELRAFDEFRTTATGPPKSSALPPPTPVRDEAPLGYGEVRVTAAEPLPPPASSPSMERTALGSSNVLDELEAWLSEIAAPRDNDDGSEA